MLDADAAHGVGLLVQQQLLHDDVVRQEEHLETINIDNLTIGWQNLNPLSHPHATLVPQAMASGENLNYVTLAPQTRPSGEILNYSLSR